MITACKVLAGLSFGSVKPNSAAVKVWPVSSKVVMVLLVPAGASFTLVSLSVTLATVLFPAASITVIA